SWLALILPYVEQGPVYKLADDWQRRTGSYLKGRPPYYWWPWGDFWANWATAPPNPALGVDIKLYKCPSDFRPLTVEDVDGMKIAFTSYLGVSGFRGDTSSGRNGVIYWRSKVRMTDMVDGTSQTGMVGERPPSLDLEYGWWFAGAGFDGSGTG